MKKNVLFSVLLCALLIKSNAEGINGDSNIRDIHLQNNQVPRPHMIDIAEPVAMYTISNSTIDITFDSTYYSEYTIHLVSDYFEIDYFVYTPVVYIPVATLGDIVDIYIESDDCGSWYGELDKAEFGGQLDI